MLKFIQAGNGLSLVDENGHCVGGIIQRPAGWQVIVNGVDVQEGLFFLLSTAKKYAEVKYFLSKKGFRNG